jgi:transcriptional regulator with XRE-family HTH domain
MKTRKDFDQLKGDIGHALAELRMQKGYDSIKDFTNDFGLPMIQYWRIEKGKANVTLKSLYKLLAIHSLSLQDFFCYINDA